MSEFLHGRIDTQAAAKMQKDWALSGKYDDDHLNCWASPPDFWSKKAKKSILYAVVGIPFHFGHIRLTRTECDRSGSAGP
ncbi:hypothetical protein [Ruegeria atlantica]|uniref:hypothetical protein n=1 Tax=Ruegeria atlantica TaxID=81569 RepID=UPI00147E22B7|nr:hypothetical protein [Ruegeria atlantica]